MVVINAIKACPPCRTAPAFILLSFSLESYSAFSTEQVLASLASKKRWLTLCVHSVSEIPPSMGGLKTCGTAPTTSL